MKQLVTILLLFAAAVALGTILQNTAYVLLVYPPYRIELSLKFFVLLLLTVFVLGYWLIHMLAATTQLPAIVQKLRLDRAQKKARKLLDVALSAFFEGRYVEAEKIAARAIKLGESSALYPIIAARSAHELEATDRRDAYLSIVGSKSPGDTTMRFMATAKFKLDQHDQQGALNALQELRDSGARVNVGVLALELKAQQQAGNWDEVLRVLEQMEKRKGIDAAQAGQVRQQALREKSRQI
ncbi:MAG: heme biosynthesis HemY N-terminal domain-containing protein [Gallionella sp.]|nr:heme biosynthesis HemY N-terminal domain-containing protein [Gallionella sp.]